LFILDRNFWNRNTRKSIKGSKDSDSSLVSNENFSETLWPSGWALRPSSMRQNDHKTISLMTSVTNNPHPSTKKFFFECKLLDSSICLSCWTAL